MINTAICGSRTCGGRDGREEVFDVFSLRGDDISPALRVYRCSSFRLEGLFGMSSGPMATSEPGGKGMFGSAGRRNNVGASAQRRTADDGVDIKPWWSTPKAELGATNCA